MQKKLKSYLLGGLLSIVAFFTFSTAADAMTVNFNTNGGRPVSSITSFSLGDIILLDNNPSYREGYDFVGWYDGNGLFANRVQSYTVGFTNLLRTYEVYAKWQVIPYLISYDLDGGKVSSNVTLYTINSNDITLNNPTKDGYKFIGWTGTNINTPQLNVKIPTGSTGNRHYKANYVKEVKLITRYFDNNGNAISQEKREDYYENDTYQATPVNVNNYVLNSNRLPANESGTFGKDDIYVDYYYNKLCTLIFETNGGSPVAAVKDIVEGTDVDLNGYNSTKDGYNFLGWYDDANLSNKISSINVSDNSTVYAGWQFIYKILAGADQTYTRLIGNDVIIVANGDRRNLDSIEIDGKKVDPNNYILESGSTILTLKKSYLDLLSLGQHKVNFIYNDGSVATSLYVVNAPNNKQNNKFVPGNKINNDTKKYCEISENPQTGDNITAYIALSVISVSAIVFVLKRFVIE